MDGTGAVSSLGYFLRYRWIQGELVGPAAALRS
jgi:hypothetical protein